MMVLNTNYALRFPLSVQSGTIAYTFAFQGNKGSRPAQSVETILFCVISFHRLSCGKGGQPGIRYSANGDPGFSVPHPEKFATTTTHSRLPVTPRCHTTT